MRKREERESKAQNARRGNKWNENRWPHGGSKWRTWNGNQTTKTIQLHRVGVNTEPTSINGSNRP